MEVLLLGTGSADGWPRSPGCCVPVPMRNAGSASATCCGSTSAICNGWSVQWDDYLGYDAELAAKDGWSVQWGDY